jgi:hypothetical protein
MPETEQSHHQHGDPNGGNIQSHRPYWTRAHRDWRVWVGVVLMLAAMIIYLTTNDLAWGPHIPSQQPPSAAPGK